MTKLTPKQVKLIRYNCQQGHWTQQDAAKVFDISQAHVSLLINKKRRAKGQSSRKEANKMAAHTARLVKWQDPDDYRSGAIPQGRNK